MSLGSKIIRGAAWMLAMRWLSRFMGLLSMVVVARLLAPADFGIYAVATALIGLLDAFTDVGTDLAVIRHPNPQRDHYDTVWTLKVILHALSALVIVLAAPLAKSLYEDDRYEAVLQLLALVMFISGFTNIGVANFRRQLEFHKDFKYNVLVQLIGVLTTLLLAFLLRSYWALVIGGLARSLASLGLSYAMEPYRPRVSLSARREMFGFSFWVMVRSVSLFLVGNGDRLVLGAFFAATITGWYAVAASLATMAVFELLHPIGRALFPGLAAKQDDPEWTTRNLKKIFSATATISAAAGLGLSALATPVLHLFYGAQFVNAGPMLSVMAIMAAVAGFNQPVGQYLMVLGRVKELSIIFAVEGILSLCITYFLAVNGAGIQAIILGRLAISILALARVFYLIRAVGEIAWRDILVAWVRPCLAAGVMYMALAGLLATLEGYSPGIVILVGVPFGSLVFMATLLSLWRLMGKPEGLESELLLKIAGR